jgi:hypothetical protein
MATAELDGGDAPDGGHQNCCEEGADVDDQQFFLQVPGKGEEKEDADGEEDVAAYGPAGLVGVGDEGGWWSSQRDLLWQNSELDAESLPDGAQGWECGGWFSVARMISTVLSGVRSAVSMVRRARRV